MANKGDPTPVRQQTRERMRILRADGTEEEVEVVSGSAVYRPMEPIELFQDKVINSTTPQLSDPIDCHAYRHFGLLIYVDSTSTPDLIRFEVEFLDRWTGKWYSFKQGLFASLYYEDTDTANGIYECFQGMCLGRAIRIKITGENVAASGNELGSSKYFTVSVAIELFN